MLALFGEGLQGDRGGARVRLGPFGIEFTKPDGLVVARVQRPAGGAPGCRAGRRETFAPGDDEKVRANPADRGISIHPAGFAE